MAEPHAEVRIAVIDDHPIARYGMQMIFAAAPGLTVVHDASSLAGLAIQRLRVDVVILDLYLDGGRLSGGDIAAAARHCPVLMVSASGRREDVLTAVRAGASGYLTKNSGGDSFIAAVRSATQGHFYMSPQLADLLDSEADGTRPDGPRISLAPRERQALAYIAQGFTQAQTATRMGVTPATIDTYMKRIRAKLGPGNKAELTRHALALGQFDDGLPGDHRRLSRGHDVTANAKSATATSFSLHERN